MGSIVSMESNTHICVRLSEHKEDMHTENCVYTRKYLRYQVKVWYTTSLLMFNLESI